MENSHENSTTSGKSRGLEAEISIINYGYRYTLKARPLRPKEFTPAYEGHKGYVLKSFKKLQG